MIMENVNDDKFLEFVCKVSQVSLNKSELVRLQELIKASEETINSKRKLHRIRSLAQFLEVLRCRSILTEKPMALQKLILQVNNEQINKMADDCLKLTTCRCCEAASANISQEAVNFVAANIGRRWMELGRLLHVNDVVLEDIDSSYNSLKEKSYQMMIFVKRNPQTGIVYQQALNEALEELGRMDLVYRLSTEVTD